MADSAPDGAVIRMAILRDVTITSVFSKTVYMMTDCEQETLACLHATIAIFGASFCFFGLKVLEVSRSISVAVLKGRDGPERYLINVFVKDPYRIKVVYQSGRLSASL